MVIGLIAAALTLNASHPGTLAPNEKNYQSWAKFIMPSEKEASYRKISWRTEFWPAVLEAKRLGRPILLWTMNGHPMGCT